MIWLVGWVGVVVRGPSGVVAPAIDSPSPAPLLARIRCLSYSIADWTIGAGVMWVDIGTPFK